MYFRRSATPCTGLTEAPNDDDGNKDTLLYYNLKKIKQKFSFPRVLILSYPGSTVWGCLEEWRGWKTVEILTEVETSSVWTFKHTGCLQHQGPIPQSNASHSLS